MVRCFSILSVAVSVGLGACSVHPLPDDVSPIPTEEIVRTMRCETKLAVRAEIAAGLKFIGLSDIVPELILEPVNLERVRQRDKERGDNLAERFLAYSVTSIAYAFDFAITEDNYANATLGFTMPFTNGTWTVSPSAAHKRTREGKRVFQTVETLAELNKLNCANFAVRDTNLTYPITGSIGMGTAVHTFVALSELGGAEKLFTDTLTFTTTISGSLTTKLTLTPVPKSFRLTSVDAAIGAGRTDIHKVTISFAFPDLRRLRLFAAADAAVQSDLTKQHALENLCIARATDREDVSGTLRFLPPESYCRQQPAAARLSGIVAPP